MGDNVPEMPEHVADYLYQRALSSLPEGVLETLASLSPEELGVLNRVGASLEEANADPSVYVFGVH
jgi:restriction endonuclease Mrr